MTRPCFDSVTSLIMLMWWRIHTRSISHYVGVVFRELQTFFQLISIRGLIKANTPRNSVATYIKKYQSFICLSVNIVGYDLLIVDYSTCFQFC